MRAQVERLRRLAGDLRDSAAAEEHALHLSRQTLDLRDEVASAATAARPRFAAKGVELAVTIGDTPAPVVADPVRMQQVLANLLDNALRHTPSGGRVALSARSDRDGDMLVEVADNGEGIPVEQLAAVFDRFHRVDKARTTADGAGSGLGLTIVRGVIEAHGGSVEAASDGPGTGARFTVRLPSVDVGDPHLGESPRT